MKKINHKLWATLALFATTVIWGNSFIIMKDSLDDMKPAYLLAVRFSLAAIVLALVFIKKWKKLNKTYWIPSALIGFLLAAAYCTQTYGLNYTTPGKNAFLTSVYCILTPFMCWIIKKSRPDIYNYLSALLCVIGIGLVSIETGAFSGGTFIGKGDLLTLICGIFYALHIVVMSIYINDLELPLVTALQFGFAAVFLWIFTFIFEGKPTAIAAPMIPGILYLAIAASAIAMFFQNYGVKYCSPSGAAIILSLESVFGILFSVLAGKEEGLNAQKLVGFALVFSAVIVSETKLSFLHKKKEKLPEPQETK